MDIPPSIQLDKPRRRRKRKSPTAAPPAPPTAPVLVSAWFDADALLLTLGFDQAVNVDAFEPAMFDLQDRPAELRYAATAGPSLSDPATVRVNVVVSGSSEGEDVVLSVDFGAGIFNAGLTMEWDGCSGVVLPFP